MADKVRWGVISTANIGRKRVVPALARASNAELVAVTSSSGGEEEFAREFDMPRAYSSYAALLEDDDIDAVYIPLPNHMHAEWTKRAADAGKQILCEKPLAMNAAQAQEMVDYCANRNVLLMEAFMYRFHPQHKEVKRLMEQGAIGTPQTFRSSFTFHVRSDDNIRLVKEYGGGSLYDVGCYCVNSARFILDAEPVEVLGEGDWSEQFGVDMRFFGLMQFEGGLRAVFDAGLRSGHTHRYQVIGTEGTITVPEAFVPPAVETTVVLRNADGEQSIDIPPVDQYQLMVEHFGECVLEGKQPWYSLEDTLNNMRAIDALYGSSRRRDWMTLN